MSTASRALYPPQPRRTLSQVLLIFATILCVGSSMAATFVLQALSILPILAQGHSERMLGDLLVILALLVGSFYLQNQLPSFILLGGLLIIANACTIKKQATQKRGWNAFMLKPHSSFIDVEGLRLHYLEWEPLHQLQHAEDNIPIVLLHGLGATADSWNLVAEQLCREHLVIAFDQRGHGQSEQAQDGYDLVTMAEDCIHGMAALGLGQVVLAGHGWGARVALVLAARHPALLSHLILVDCPHVEPRHWPGMTRERFIREKLDKETYPSAEDFLETIHKEMESFWSPEIAQILLTYVQHHDDGSVEELLKSANQKLIRAAIWDDRALSYYGKLACPVLLVPAAAVPHASDELPEHLENADEFASAKGIMAAQVARIIHQCTIAWMPDTSHDIQFQRPQRLAEVITDFIH